MKITSGPAIERSGDLAAMLSNLAPGDVLFIDEIHRIARPAEELLYMAMEDFRVDVVVGKGPGRDRDPAGDQPVHPGRRHHPRRPAHRAAARPVRVRRPDGVLRAGRAAAGAAPAAPRCSGVELTDDGSRGDRRPLPGHTAHRQPAAAPGARLRRGRGRRAGRPATVARAALALYDVDDLGLDRLDRAVLEALVGAFGGGPVGVATLAVAVGEEPNTVEEVCEPFLVRAGLLARTSRGRVATEAAWRHLGHAVAPWRCPARWGGWGDQWPDRCAVDPGCVARAPVRRLDSVSLARNPTGRGRARPVRSPARAVHRRGTRRTRAVRTGPAPDRGAARAVERHICRGAVLPARSCSPCSPCVLFVLPARQRKRMAAQAQALQESLAIGTPVMTTSGLHGTVAGLGDKTVDLEIAPGVVVDFARQAILEVRKPAVGTTDGVTDDGTPGDAGRTPGRRHPLSRATPWPTARCRRAGTSAPSLLIVAVLYALVFFTGSSRRRSSAWTCAAAPPSR